jgi:signal transduction histidine kinase
VRRAGLAVTADLDDTLSGRPVTGQVTYRIVQESLSNILRHAPGAASAVRVRGEGTTVVVTIENAATDGSAEVSAGSAAETSIGEDVVEDRDARTASEAGAAGARDTAAGDGAAQAPAGWGAIADGTARAGHGLIGMRERARLVGGTIEVGPTPLGGFRVHAVLPMSAPLEGS